MSVEQQSRSDAEVKELVRDRYASAAVRVIQSERLRAWLLRRDPVSIRSQSIFTSRARRPSARGGDPGVARLRQPDRAGQAQRRRDRARSRLGRRHRCPALGAGGSARPGSPTGST